MYFYSIYLNAVYNLDFSVSLYNEPYLPPMSGRSLLSQPCSSLFNIKVVSLSQTLGDNTQVLFMGTSSQSSSSCLLEPNPVLQYEAEKQKMLKRQRHSLTVQDADYKQCLVCIVSIFGFMVFFFFFVISSSPGDKMKPLENFTWFCKCPSVFCSCSLCLII